MMSSTRSFTSGDGMARSITTSFKYKNFTHIPSSIDWRQRGAVTPRAVTELFANKLELGSLRARLGSLRTRARTQKHVRACWAFATVAAIEGKLRIATDVRVAMSMRHLIMSQKMVECAPEIDYPYKKNQSTCDIKKVSPHIVKFPIHGYDVVTSYSEETLLKAVTNQLVSASISSGGDFGDYSGEIFRGPCGTVLDHVVTIVGYGRDDNDTKYWILKNSWGSGWREEVFMRLLRDVDEEGLCGITTYATFPHIHHLK
ncbi:Senescence-specific cysteine protease sag12 [Orobanche gracilis]